MQDPSNIKLILAEKEKFKAKNIFSYDVDTF